MLANFPHHRQQGNVSFVSTSRGTQQLVRHVLVRLDCCFVDPRLNPVQRLEAFKCRLSVLSELVDGQQQLIRVETASERAVENGESESRKVG